MFRHIIRGEQDQALYHAAHGDPKLMLQYYEQVQSTEDYSGAPGTDAPGEDVPRHVEINGEPLTDTAWAFILQLERIAGGSLPDGAYWYDATSGAFGVWGQGTWLFLPPNLPIAGPLPMNCSGPPTNVVINGRDIHPTDLQALILYFGYFPQGYYYFDAAGNLGALGCPPMANLRLMMG